eukprot:1283927-Pyramimonas_sp.AAC.1
MQNVRVNVGKAWRGLIAGCGWATYMVQMYVLAPRRAVGSHAQLDSPRDVYRRFIAAMPCYEL